MKTDNVYFPTKLNRRALCRFNINYDFGKMESLRKILIISVLFPFISGCDLAVKKLPGGYSITEMNEWEFRLITPSGRVLPSNIASYGVSQDRFVFGECTRMYLDAKSDPDAKTGLFILDTVTADYDYGISLSEYNKKLNEIGVKNQTLKTLMNIP